MTWKNAPSVRRLTLWASGIAIVTLAAPTICSAEEITIEIAPATLNLQSHGKVVTVHTDIPFTEIEQDTATLALETATDEDVLIDFWKADDRGYFVAKFLIDDIKDLDLLSNKYNRLKFLAWNKTSEEPVWGFAEVMVIDVDDDLAPRRAGGRKGAQ